jgi:hypothetical protein
MNFTGREYAGREGRGLEHPRHAQRPRSSVGRALRETPGLNTGLIMVTGEVLRNNSTVAGRPRRYRPTP